MPAIDAKVFFPQRSRLWTCYQCITCYPIMFDFAPITGYSKHMVVIVGDYDNRFSLPDIRLKEALDH